MKNIVIVIFIIFFSGNLAYSQNEDITIIEKSFLDVVNAELIILKNTELIILNSEGEIGDNNKCTLTYTSKYLLPYAGYQQVFLDNYEYDIQKTNSIISPYKGIVSFKFNWFHMEGNSKEECKKNKSFVSKFNLTYVYAYQNKAWVLKSKADQRLELIKEFETSIPLLDIQDILCKFAKNLNHSVHTTVRKGYLGIRRSGKLSMNIARWCVS